MTPDSQTSEPQRVTQPSYRQHVPPLAGGVAARRGFRFQDQVAVGFLIRMLEDDTLAEVWCEFADDILLVWKRPAEGAELEFVQAKGEQHDQLWSLALLCRREGSADRPTPSIMEHSLGWDRFEEPSLFRVVTARPWHSQLRPLTLERGHQGRVGAIPSVIDAFRGRGAPLTDLRSPKGNDFAFWVERVVLDTRHSEEAVRDANVLALVRAIQAMGFPLLFDQGESLYPILERAALLSAAPALEAPTSAHGLPQTALRDAIRQRVVALGRAGTTTAPQSLDQALLAAGVGSTGVQYAREARRAYQKARRAQTYVSQSALGDWEGVVAVTLNRLWRAYQLGEIDETPLAFHDRCCRGVEAVTADHTTTARPAILVLHGVMYELVRRGIHGFVRQTI